jgi:hypothetical protein
MRATSAAFLALVAVACTPTTSTPPPTHPPEPSPVTFAGIHFDVGCTPVAEALIDIELPHHGQPKMRAITGLWDHQAVAVLANDPKGCGVWTLALATGLSPTTRSQIQDETAKGVAIFGVTASPVPRSEGR